MGEERKSGKKSFTMENYGKQSVFANFLPGISGKWGIPIWCYYVNRGQAVVSFGLEDKDHAIMEFYPAHQAYQTVKTTGFRTFLSLDGVYAEPFSDVEVPHGMRIERNGLVIWEENKHTGIRTEITYFALPGEYVGGLVRKVSLQNLTERSMKLEALDGMPAVVPFGTAMWALKEMGQTAKAWMQVEDTESRIPLFRLRASLVDTAVVTAVTGGNFSLGVDENGEKLKVIVDPDAVFSFDNSLQVAQRFAEGGLKEVFAREQVVSNQFPCSFFGMERTLEPGETTVIYELFGQVRHQRELEHFKTISLSPAWFASREREAFFLTEELCSVIETSTGNPDFDEYCRYTYMDNVLRGGYPTLLPGGKVFYLYSRKHGDLERDYNYFRMLPEYYSQGNGNFRDVNQNRRMDSFFTPYVGKDNIKKFYNLIQLDGYNPLAVEQVSFTLPEEAVDTIFDELSQEQKEELMIYLTDSFTPGGFYRKMQELHIWDRGRQDAFFARTMEECEENVNARFGEGYWCDHWTYNLDLVESYLSVYPERKTELMMEQEYTYFACQIPILPRIKRYVHVENGIRQYNFLDETMKRNDGDTLVMSRFGLGEPVKVSLLEKMLVLCATKYAALDAYGMGVEMEGGKPGWYDALNGLPGLFGSSMNETYELARLLHFVLDVLPQCPTRLEVTWEVATLLRELYTVNGQYRKDIHRMDELVEFWNRRNEVKEDYVARTFHGISGEKDTMDKEEVRKILLEFQQTVQCGIRKALSYGGDMIPSYFIYEVEEYTETKEGIMPKHFALRRMPAFLEGTVRFLKLENVAINKKEIYEQVKRSDLYDRELKMYKVNASLAECSYEVGRAKAFTPGWLENESIWMHMEYKYLLELLRSGLYREFLEDFHNGAIPFQDPSRYGRSIYENSSFIASSRNPNAAYRGKGFVARLSGSTVEFLHMWKIMMFGERLFTAENGFLQVNFAPTLPAWLIRDDLTVEAILLGHTRVTYHFKEKRDYYPGEYRVTRVLAERREGGALKVDGSVVPNQMAYEIRDGKMSRIDIWIQ